ncbi:hypothetical protein A3D77_06155 [Candidatus Gottesmanbacteria bacterium RIFCSPHIGHO2_02_FULL_39_11]|uniref:Uncharacterized protein n=1 Tax=Candidatus Gottesmanbacteria bacterium RIFCSPHIGHO2_02_FULL_39_11 TaxID=1798382 RepID=A0A1F5ZVQ5_9BACT|nr:MAG: hypothetical protein A3D77_06155 [Candidatus Gottesmanbacteria bacterium RIFCSPHIGHO2_02_FULL_39_11]
MEARGRNKQFAYGTFEKKKSRPANAVRPPGLSAIGRIPPCWPIAFTKAAKMILPFRPHSFTKVAESELRDIKL